MKAKVIIPLIALGVLFMSFPAKGIRNNNPGNIRYNPANDWNGQIGDDGTGFAVFSNPAYGIRAMGKLLKNYYDRYNLTTIADVINRWAPPSENDTESYIKFVSERMGKDANAILFIGVPGSTDTTALVEAIIRVENGYAPYTLNFIQQSIDLV